MPSALVKKYADKHDMPITKAEERWEKAKSIASEKFRHDSKKFWPYVTGIFKKMMGESEVMSFADFILLESDQGQYKNDTAERAMIHKIVELAHAAGLMKGGVKTEENLQLAYDFLESDWGGRLWDKHYELFSTMHPSFEGPFDKRRYGNFKREAVAWFRKWKNGAKLPADVEKLPRLHEGDERISDLPEEEKRDAIIAELKKWPEEFVVGNMACSQTIFQIPKVRIFSQIMVSYALEQLMGERLPISARVVYGMNPESGFVNMRWVLINDTGPKSAVTANKIFEVAEIDVETSVDFEKFKLWVNHNLKKQLPHLMEGKLPSIKKGIGDWPEEIMLRDGYYLELGRITPVKAIYNFKRLMDDKPRYGRLYISKRAEDLLIWQVQKPAPEGVDQIDGGPVDTRTFDARLTGHLAQPDADKAFDLDELRSFANAALKKLPLPDRGK